jgi:sporulation protein YlmC with PRC-barrel domain
MKITDDLKLASEVRDLQIMDCDGKRVGIADDIELEGEIGKSLKILALLVGPGAYSDRLPRWLTWCIHAIAGKEIVRIPWNEIDSITSVITLKGSAEQYGLYKAEKRAMKIIKKIPLSS